MKSLAVFVVAGVVAGCGGGGGDSHSCLVLNTGNKVCGQDAISWCDATAQYQDAATIVNCDIVKMDG